MASTTKIITILALMVGSSVGQRKVFLSDQSNPLFASKVTPDVFDIVPAQIMTVSFGKAPVSLGNILTTNEVKNTPSAVSWEADPNKFYTLALVDPDAPSRAAPLLGEWLHWLVVNIPGNNILQGMTLSPYIPAGPLRWTGLHRFVFAVYEQPDKIMTRPDDLNNNSNWSRIRFSIRKFAQQHNMGEPIAANFFQAQNERN